MKKSHWKLNTSNLGKYREFKYLFNKYGHTLDVTHIELEEIDADLIEVIAHKASQLEEGVIVDDTSLHVDEASIGVNIRWLINHLTDYIGHKAEWIVLMAYREKDIIYIFKGSIQGTISAPQGKNGYGFDSFFVPEGCTCTMAESKPDEYNARVYAVMALINGDVWKTHPAIKEWNGKWQPHE